jgi:hypothetical protein
MIHVNYQGVNIHQATAVLLLLEQVAAKASLDYTFEVGHYENGRETGFYVTCNGRSVAFSEYRNTDQIVIYHGDAVDFTGLTDMRISDKIYDNKFFVGYGEFKRAANLIANWLALGTAIK